VQQDDGDPVAAGVVDPESQGEQKLAIDPGHAG
jgi:hypothetical protein